MQLTESSIYIGLKRLRQQLYTCQFLMSKGDRIVYGTPLMQECGLTIANFVVAFTVGADKMRKLEEAIGQQYFNTAEGATNRLYTAVSNGNGSLAWQN